MTFLDNVQSLNTRENKHFTLKRMDKNDDSNYNFLIDEQDKVLDIQKTLSNSSIKI